MILAALAVNWQAAGVIIAFVGLCAELLRRHQSRAIEEVRAVRRDMNGGFGSIRTEVGGVRDEVANVRERVASIEGIYRFRRRWWER